MPRRTKAKSKRSTRQTHSEGDRILHQMLTYFRKREGPLRRRWIKEMEAGGYVRGGTSEELKADSVGIYETYLTCLETGHYHRAQALAKAMAARGVLRRLTPKHIFGALLTLQGVCEEALTQKYHETPDRLIGKSM